MFKEIKESFGSALVREVRSHIKTSLCIVRHRTHLHFNHTCLKHQALPKSLRSKPLLNSAEGRKLARKYGFQNLRLRIRSSHCRIKFCKSKVEELCCSLSKNLPVNIFEKLRNICKKDKTSYLRSSTLLTGICLIRCYKENPENIVFLPRLKNV